MADGNASSDYTRFHGAPDGLAAIDASITFAGDPRDSSPSAFYERKRRQCAEVLVPDLISSHHITGAYVSCEGSYERCVALELPGSLVVDSGKFFRA